MDNRRFFLLWKKNCITVAIAVVLGALLGAIIYGIYYKQVTKVPVYKCEADFYITANDNQGYNYFNGYTWRDEVKKARIIDPAMEALRGLRPDTDITDEDIRNAVDADIMADLRIVTVTVRTSDPEKTELIMKAMAESMVVFAEQVPEFDSISMWSMETVTQEIKDNLVFHAIILGMVIGLILWFIVYGLYYAMDDRICVEQDVKTDSAITVLGYRTVQSVSFYQDLLLAKLEQLQGSDQIAEMSVSDQQSWIHFLQEHQGEKVLLKVSFHKTNQKQIDLAVSECEKFAIKPVGVIIADADARFLDGYYRWIRKD